MKRLGTVPTILVVISTWDGFGYAFGPREWSSSKALVPLSGLPGGIRPYGVALLIGAAVIVWGWRSQAQLRYRRVFAGELIVSGLYISLGASVLLSWTTEGIAAWGGASKGPGIAALAIWASVREYRARVHAT